MKGRKRVDKILEIEFPVYYSEHVPAIFDAKNRKVVDIRGWGRLQYLENPEKKQDDIGKFIAQAMNDRYYNNELWLDE